MMLLQDAAPLSKTHSLTKLSIVVPCYNEEQGLDQLTERLETLRAVFQDRMLVEVVFVDDGSSDQTATGLDLRIGQFDWAKVIRHQSNRGITAAIMTGIRNASHELVATIDADCTYDPLQLAGLLDLMSDDVAMVTASPYHPNGEVEGVPRWRLGLSRIASSCYGVLLGTRLHTYTSCFRVHRRSFVEKLDIRQDGFVGVAEMLWQIQKHGGTIVEAPAKLTSRRLGFSKMKTLPVIFAHLQLMLRILADRLLGGLPSRKSTR
jgi:dolichol-phosphate mannosyltransferase